MEVYVNQWVLSLDSANHERHCPRRAPEHVVELSQWPVPQARRVGREGAISSDT